MEATPSVMMAENVLRWIVNTDFATENTLLNFALNLMPGRVEEARVDGVESVSGSRPTFFLPVRQLRGFDVDPARHVNRRPGTDGWLVCQTGRRFEPRKNSIDVRRGNQRIVEIPKGRTPRSKIDRSARPDFRAVGDGLIQVFIHRNGFAFTIAREREVLAEPCLFQDVSGGCAGVDGDLRVAASGSVCD